MASGLFEILHVRCRTRLWFRPTLRAGVTREGNALKDDLKQG